MNDLSSADQVDQVDQWVMEPEALQDVLDALVRRGYQPVGPTVRDGVIIYDDLRCVADLPIGWTDEQEGGTYRLRRRNDHAFFGYNVGPHSWKRFLHPPLKRMWRARRTDHGFEIETGDSDAPAYAFIGVRACELHAMRRQDDVFLGGEHVEMDYQRRRAAAFILAVNCGQAGKTCFCSSMQTGPQVEDGYDLALTELLAPEHLFVVTVGSLVGAAVLDETPHRPATPEEAQQAQAVVDEAAGHMGRALNTTGLHDALLAAFEHPHWEVVAERCLTCGNCTLVCPTCFCHTVEDVTDLTGQTAERWRRDDSCFTTAFSFISSGSVRSSARSRYRQWLTHKLATWVDQFGVYGCVGCGRCITWCPVGIDITAEAAALTASESTSGGASPTTAVRQLA